MPAMLDVSTCAHPSASRFRDTDEMRCRDCSQSLTYPPRLPTPADETDRRRDAHRAHKPVEVQVEAEAEAEVVEVAIDPMPLSQRREVEVNNPSTQLLICHCCKEKLPLESFHVRNHPAAKNRAYRASMCRGCLAFRARVKREADPEGMKQRDRGRRQRYWDSLTPVERERNRTGKEANTAAAQRHRARQDGRGVPLQRPGRLSIHVKPICRIFEGCPLRSFCTTQSKGLT